MTDEIDDFNDRITAFENAAREYEANILDTGSVGAAETQRQRRNAARAALRARYDTVVRERDEARVALAWYGDEANYIESHGVHVTYLGDAKICGDGGQRARAALAKANAPKEGEG